MSDAQEPITVTTSVDQGVAHIGLSGELDLHSSGELSAAVGTVVLLGSLVLLRPVRRVIRRRWVRATTVVRVELREGVDPEAVARRFEDGDGIEIVHLKVHKHQGQMVLVSEVIGHPTTVRHWVTRLATDDDVESVGED